jgi:mxaJ protein
MNPLRFAWRALHFGVALSLITLAHVGHVAAAGAQPLRVCADPDYLPYSNRAGQGFENKIAQVVGHAMGRPVVFVWGSTRGEDGFDEVIHTQLNTGKCDVLVDVPYSVPNVNTTKPYYISSYVFIYKKSAGYDLQSLDSPILHHVKIGYEADTPAEEGLKLRALTIGAKPFLTADDENASPSEIVSAIESGQINVGISWDPAVATYVAKHPGLTTVIVPNSRSQGSPEQYSFPMSMATRANDKTLGAQLDDVIAKHRSELAGVLRSYNIHFFEPGDST